MLEAEPDSRRPAWMTRWWIISAALIATVLIGGTARVLLAPEPARPAPRPAPAAPAPVADRCPDANVLPPPRSGAEHSWIQLGSVLAPFDPRIGPHDGGGGQPPACFAPGDAGA